MSSIVERSNRSNTEKIVINHELLNLKEHLTINKILLSKSEVVDKDAKGFFKLCRGNLELHVCIPREGKKEWIRLVVLDATPTESDHNKKLNIYEE